MIRGEFTLLNLEKGKVGGHFALLVAPDNQAHIQIELPGVNEHIWIHDQLEWRSGEPERPPRQLTGLEVALQLRDLLRANYSDAKFKSSRKKIDGAEQVCLQIQQRGFMVPLVCIDDNNHTPSRLQFNAFDFLFSDYRSEGKGAVPFSLRMKDNGFDALSASVTDVAPIDASEKLLLPPLGAGPLAGLSCIAGSDDVKYREEPVYPATARIARIQGLVRLEVVVDDSGRVRSVNLVSGHPMLAPAAAAAVAHWVFKPHVCDGVNVGLHRVITVDFTLD